jgi:hypothetical protein
MPIGFVVIRREIFGSRATFATARGGSDAQRLVRTDPFHWSYTALQAGIKTAREPAAKLLKCAGSS